MRTIQPSMLLLAALAAAAPALAADPAALPPAAQPVAPAAAAAVPAQPQAQRCTSITTDGEPTQVTLGKSTVIPLRSRVVRVVVGGGRAAAPAPAAPPTGAAGQPAAPPASAGVADLDVVLLSPLDLFFRGRQPGATNVVLQNAQGACFIKEIVVTVDPGALQSKLAELMPEETGIRVRSAESSIVLTGEISNALRLDDVMSLAAAYGSEGKKIVNLMRVTSPQQVMLEVKIAEVSKTLIDKLGARVGLNRGASGALQTWSLVSDFLSGGGGLLSGLKAGRTRIDIDGQNDDGLVRILAEPNIMAISGQQASFLSGGKIFIPVAQSNNTNFLTTTLEEKEFGIGVKFTPTVLGGQRVNLKMVSEVSDLSQTGSPFTTIGGATAVLPSLSVRRADTTVQLNDGQSLVIAGLIKNNVTEAVKRYPGLGEVPVMGALFRSTEFQNDKTELMFVITPRLVRPLPDSPRLPTDNHVVPNRVEVYLNGALESSTPAPAPSPAPANPNSADPAAPRTTP